MCALHNAIKMYYYFILIIIKKPSSKTWTHISAFNVLSRAPSQSESWTRRVFESVRVKVIAKKGFFSR